jgi:hypothetical protein
MTQAINGAVGEDDRQGLSNIKTQFSGANTLMN